MAPVGAAVWPQLPLLQGTQAEIISAKSLKQSVRFALRATRKIPSEDSEPSYVPLIKMCGVTRPEDASDAARAGAAFVGMIMWPKSRRSVSFGLAKEIAAAARAQGAEPVGVFVDEDAKAIENACNKAGIRIAQLHGDGARRAALTSLSSSLEMIYVLHADKYGKVQNELPSLSRPVWVLVDSLQGGSGESFDWNNFRVPACSAKGWFLAGGLHPGNVATAVKLLKPTAVDVSSGITSPDGLTKDVARMRSFVEAATTYSALK